MLNNEQLINQQIQNSQIKQHLILLGISQLIAKGEIDFNKLQVCLGILNDAKQDEMFYKKMIESKETRKEEAREKLGLTDRS